MEPQVWLITGASSGFGALLAEKALQAGHYVIATARNPT
jgi:NADP-dependent 3-hydroxy acid dehydrogenase YdfG